MASHLYAAQRNSSLHANVRDSGDVSSETNISRSSSNNSNGNGTGNGHSSSEYESANLKQNTTTNNNHNISTTSQSKSNCTGEKSSKTRDGKRNLYEFLCLILACTLCYYNSTQCSFVFDDISAIRDNKDLRPNTPLRNVFLNDFWGTPIRKEQSHKSYRPFTVLTFRINYWWHELQPYGYHLVNVLLHTIVCVLWRRVCRLLLWQCHAGAVMKLPSNSIAMKLKMELLNRCSFLAALLFAVHPIHTEAVTGVVGRAELLSSICYLAAFLSYAKAVTVVMPSSAASASSTTTSSSAVRRRLHTTTLANCNNNNITNVSATATTQWSVLDVQFVIWLVASMLCKEQGITIAGICVAYELFVVQQLRPLQLWYYVQKFFDETPTTPNKQNGSPSSSSTATAMIAGNGFGGGVKQQQQRITIVQIVRQCWRSDAVKRLTFVVCVTFALLVARVRVMGSQLPVFTRFDNPAASAPMPTRQLTYSYLIYLNIRLLLFPCDLCCDWTMGTIPLLEHFADVRNVATLLTFVGLCALIVRACIVRCMPHARTLLMCLAWLVLPFVPASNLFFPVGFVVAERVLYMPSMGFCLLIAYGYTQMQQQFQRIGGTTKSLGWLLKCALALLLLTHALKTHVRNWDWHNEYTLFMSGVHVNGRNAKLFNNVGHVLENEARFEEALAYFQQAVHIQNDDIGAHINVGRTYNNLKLYDEAEAAYRRAKALFPQIKPGESYQARIAPSHLNVFINLANLIAKNQTRLEEADYLYRQAISMRADYVQAYINRGDILMKLNRTAQAQQVYEQALLYDSDNADIYYNLGVVALEQGKSAQANVYFNKAIELNPEHEQALLNSAVLLQELGGTDARQLARERLYKVLIRDENNEKIYFNLGMLAMDEANFDEAEQYFKRAIHLKAGFRSALFNLALLLADANRPLDAVPYLNQLIRHHPDHIKGLILLGDIYINHMKDLDAAEICYRSILKHEPHNIQGLHNLCVVFVERKAMAKAHACLRYALHLAPGEDYIRRHFDIVQTRLAKIAKLPPNAGEHLDAYRDFDPNEFQLPTAAVPTTTAPLPPSTPTQTPTHTKQQS